MARAEPMRTYALLVALVLSAAALAGCTGGNDGTTTTTTTTTPTQTSTTTTTVPTVTPPVNGTGKGVAALVTVANPPARGPAGGNALVCWNVTGTGNVAHTAIHWDNESHANLTTKFSDYDQGAVYPGNKTQADAAGYNLPGTFCANVPVPANGTVYYRAHVIDATGAPGRLSDEQKIVATGNATSIRILSSPASATGGTNATVCWEVVGTANVAHTALHWDSESHAASTTTFSDYDQGATYPGNKTSADAAGYNLPGTFCSSIPVPATGTVFFRAHVIDAAGAPGKLSDEAAITAA